MYAARHNSFGRANEKEVKKEKGIGGPESSFYFKMKDNSLLYADRKDQLIHSFLQGQIYGARPVSQALRTQIKTDKALVESKGETVTRR